MARWSYPQSSEARPAALPPGERTIGQLVAETLQIYGDRFFRCLAVGVPIAALGLVATHTPESVGLVVSAPVTAVLVSAAYVYAAMVVLEREPPRRQILLAWLTGVLVFLPLTFLVRIYVLPAIAWYAAFGLAVPAIVAEGLGLRAALVRGWRLARADFVHALGSLVTLAIVVFLTQAVLIYFLRGVGDAAAETAFVLANVVISPVLFLGAALLYVDQAARVE